VDILNYERPTDEEVGRVLAFWDDVRRVVQIGGTRQKDVPPDDLLQRVAVHQQWQEAMLCKHPSITMAYNEQPRCSECDRPVQFLSDVQVQDLSCISEQ
jgi:hypothetical protein